MLKYNQKQNVNSVRSNFPLTVSFHLLIFLFFQQIHFEGLIYTKYLMGDGNKVKSSVVVELVFMELTV